MAVLLSGGCEAGPFEPAPDGSFLKASVVGAVEREFEGRGRFFANGDPRRPAMPLKFGIYSQGAGTASNQRVHIIRREAGVPEPGVYPLGSLQDGFHAAYQVLDRWGATREYYPGTEGELEITAADASRIEGTFRFVAYDACDVKAGAMICAHGPQLDPDTPRIEVSGSFVAYR